MKTHLFSLKKTLFFAMPVFFVTTFSYGQPVPKITAPTKIFSTPVVNTNLIKQPVQKSLLGSLGSSVAVYTSGPVFRTPIQSQITAPAHSSFYLMTDTETAGTQELLRKTLAKPAKNFAGLFKQVVYLHRNTPSIIKKITPDYFYEINLILQHAAHINNTQGYAALASFLKQNKGQIPTLNQDGTLLASDPASQLLTWYAAEELEQVLEQIISRPTAKQEIPNEEWITINVLSVMLPQRTRPVFYNLLLDKKYKELQILAQDPYMSNSKTRQAINGKISLDKINTSSVTKRIQERENKLKKLTQRKKELESIRKHQQRELTKKQIISEILKNEGQLQHVNRAETEQKKMERSFANLQKQLNVLDSEIQRLTAELDWLRSK